MGTVCVKGEKLDKNLPLSEVLSKKINNVDILIQKGDIIEVSVDAIVNASDQKTSNQLTKHAGAKVEEEIFKHTEVAKGKTFITKAGNLKAKNLINVNLPVWVGSDEAKETEKIKEALDAVFQSVVENKFASIGFPEIFSGPFVIPGVLGANLLISRIIQFCKEKTDEFKFERIHIVHHDSAKLKLYVEELEKLTLELKSSQESSNPPVQSDEKKIENGSEEQKNIEPVVHNEEHLKQAQPEIPKEESSEEKHHEEHQVKSVPPEEHHIEEPPKEFPKEELPIEEIKQEQEKPIEEPPKENPSQEEPPKQEPVQEVAQEEKQPEEKPEEEHHEVIENPKENNEEHQHEVIPNQEEPAEKEPVEEKEVNHEENKQEEPAEQINSQENAENLEGDKKDLE